MDGLILFCEIIIKPQIKIIWSTDVYFIITAPLTPSKVLMNVHFALLWHLDGTANCYNTALVMIVCHQILLVIYCTVAYYKT